MDLREIKDLSQTRSRILSTKEGARLQYQRATLLVEAGPEIGMEYPLVDRPVVIGRGETADLRLDDPTVSREHARLEPGEGGGWTVRDLGSRAGTRVEGVRVESAALALGQVLRLGESQLRVRVEQAELRAPPSRAATFEGIVGQSPVMRQLFGLVEKVAPLDLPVLLQGESGTGKERLARALHVRGAAPDGPYVVVDCTLLGEGEHLRSELFGHVRGAFTGAESDREGAFRRAHGGTLFLDEVGELPSALQAQLLRVLQEGEVRPLGGTEVTRVRVRVVAATNRNLEAMVAAGDFRKDLLYRISAITLEVPPLRDRAQDVLELARHFLPDGVTLGPDAASALLAHTWPGNVRELEYAVRQAAAVGNGAEIQGADLRLRGGADAPAPAARPPMSRKARVASLTRRELLEALEKAGGNRNQAAKLLGVSRATVFRKLKEME